MSRTVDILGSFGLERSCGSLGDSIRFGHGLQGIDRAEVRLSSHGFAPHRHDSYAIGITTAGIQTFRYRGNSQACLPGQIHILHPDEQHDGRAGTDEGFAYRIIYVAPETVREALGGRALPFVPDPVHNPASQLRPMISLLTDIDNPMSDLAHVDTAATIADCLTVLADGSSDRGLVDATAVERARQYLAVHACEQTSAAVLETITGQDRFTLSRHFRRAFGTSPDRYRTLRRVALARKAIEQGEPLAQVAAETGFADQSHLTRQFKNTYGVTPALWASLTKSPQWARERTTPRTA